MTNPTLQLDGEVLLQQLQQLGAIGADPEHGGRSRIALTDADRAGRDALVQWMRDLDLEVRIDQIGNVFGILAAADGNADKDALMIGSHIDSVRNAGALDGCYGVLAGLAVVRAYRLAHCLPQRPIVVAAFTNEEGVRYQPDMMGSLVYAGGLSLQAAWDSIGTDGSRLQDELVRIGYAGEMLVGSLRPAQYLELHIEQGPILEAENTAIGVVENLQGISWQKVTVQGVANHAGTTPTHLRHDAGYVAAATIAFLREHIAAPSNGNTLATVGAVSVAPNVINVIPRSAEFSVDLRDPDEARLQQAEAKLAAFLERIAEQEGVSISTERLVRFEPVVFDAGLVQHIAAVTTQLGLSQRRMTSGAGHDAQMLARIAPAAMIFVPSHLGISHNPREHTDAAQLCQGAQVLLATVERCLAAPILA